MDVFFENFRFLGWMDYVEMKCVSYHPLILECLNSLHVDWTESFKGQEVVISFRMFNMDHRIGLRDLMNYSTFWFMRTHF